MAKKQLRLSKKPPISGRKMIFGVSLFSGIVIAASVLLPRTVIQPQATADEVIAKPSVTAATEDAKVQEQPASQDEQLRLGEPSAAEKKRYEAELLEVIKTHPHPLVKTFLWEHMLSGKVLGGFSFGPKKDGVKGGVAKALYDTSTPPGQIKFLVIIDTFFADITKRGDRQMGVYHEALHVKKMVDNPHLLHFHDPSKHVGSEEQVSYHFEEEARTYWLQCEFGVEHNLVDGARDRFCLNYKQNGRSQLWLRQRLARVLPDKMPKAYGAHRTKIWEWANDQSRFHTK